MTRWIMIGTGVLAALGASLDAQNVSVSEATFHRDVLPILQKRCQPCHRAGRGGADVVPHVRQRPPVGEGDQGGGRREKDASLESPICLPPT